jgi:organic radical activating enzyme
MTEQKEPTLLVSELFVSVQGEGPSVGKPAAFLRLGGCNLACSFCDTPYSWDAERYDLKKELTPMNVETVAQWVVERAPGRLIVTGGEPLIQHKRVAEMLARSDALGDAESERQRVCVEVETNGTVAPSQALCARVDQWNVSPKLANSAEPEGRRIREGVLGVFAALPNSFFKFVVSDHSDLREVLELMDRFSVPKERVLLMPEAATKEQLRARGPLVAQWALRRQLRYSGRLHLELFDGKRGR